MLLDWQDTEDGGETAFPQGSEWADESMPERIGPFSECARDHVAVKPKKGGPLPGSCSLAAFIVLVCIRGRACRQIS